MMNKFRTVSPSRQTVVTVKYTNIHISTSTISVDILIVHMQLGTIPVYDSKLQFLNFATNEIQRVILSTAFLKIESSQLGWSAFTFCAKS